MKCVIIYWSRYGNGEKIVKYIAKKLKDKKADTKILKTNEADPKAMPNADLYVFSAPTEAFSIQRDMKTFMKNLEGLQDKKYTIINTHAMKKSTLSKMEKILDKKKMIKIAEIDFKIGDGVKEGNGLPKEWQEKVDEFVAKL
jgi:flavodoxin